MHLVFLLIRSLILLSLIIVLWPVRVLFANFSFRLEGGATHAAANKNDQKHYYKSNSNHDDKLLKCKTHSKDLLATVCHINFFLI